MRGEHAEARLLPVERAGSVELLELARSSSARAEAVLAPGASAGGAEPPPLVAAPAAEGEGEGVGDLRGETAMGSASTQQLLLAPHRSMSLGA